MLFRQILAALLPLLGSVLAEPVPSYPTSKSCRNGPITLHGRLCEQTCGVEFTSGSYRYNRQPSYGDCANACAVDARCAGAKWNYKTKSCYYIDSSRTPYWQKTGKADGIRCKPKSYPRPTTTTTGRRTSTTTSRISTTTAASCPRSGMSPGRRQYDVQCGKAFTGTRITRPAQKRQNVRSFLECQARCDALRGVALNFDTRTGACEVFSRITSIVSRTGVVAARVIQAVTTTTTTTTRASSTTSSAASTSSLVTTSSSATTSSSTTVSRSSSTTASTSTSSSSTSSSTRASSTTDLSSTSSSTTVSSSTSSSTTSSSTTASSTTASSTTSSSTTSSSTTASLTTSSSTSSSTTSSYTTSSSSTISSSTSSSTTSSSTTSSSTTSSSTTSSSTTSSSTTSSSTTSSSTTSLSTTSSSSTSSSSTSSTTSPAATGCAADPPVSPEVSGFEAKCNTIFDSGILGETQVESQDQCINECKGAGKSCGGVMFWREADASNPKGKCKLLWRGDPGEPAMRSGVDAFVLPGTECAATPASPPTVPGFVTSCNRASSADSQTQTITSTMAECVKRCEDAGSTCKAVNWWRRARAGQPRGRCDLLGGNVAQSVGLDGIDFALREAPAPTGCAADPAVAPSVLGFDSFCNKLVVGVGTAFRTDPGVNSFEDCIQRCNALGESTCKGAMFLRVKTGEDEPGSCKLYGPGATDVTRDSPGRDIALRPPPPPTECGASPPELPSVAGYEMACNKGITGQIFQLYDTGTFKACLEKCNDLGKEDCKGVKFLRTGGGGIKAGTCQALSSVTAESVRAEPGADYAARSAPPASCEADPAIAPTEPGFIAQCNFVITSTDLDSPKYGYTYDQCMEYCKTLGDEICAGFSFYRTIGHGQPQGTCQVFNEIGDQQGEASNGIDSARRVKSSSPVIVESYVY